MEDSLDLGKHTGHIQCMCRVDVDFWKMMHVSQVEADVQKVGS